MQSPQPMAIPSRSFDTLIVSGTVLNASTHYPIEGMLVQVHYVEPSPEVGIPHPAASLLGSGVSDSAGNFSISWFPGPAVATKVCLLAHCSEAKWIISVRPGVDQRPLLELPPASPDSTTVRLDLRVPVPVKKITQAQWAELGERAENAELVKLNTLVGQLNGTASVHSTFSDWSSMQRQNALDEIEAAFLDPHHVLRAIKPIPAWQTLAALGGLEAYQESLGTTAHEPRVQAALDEVSRKLVAFSSLSEVDWRIDPSLFGEGNLAGAITAHQGDYFGTFPKPSLLTDWWNSEIGYRDYLRTQWTSAITTVVYVRPHMLTEAQAEEQLRNRFHQDFRTTDTTTASPNEILIPILTEILTTAPGNTFGFGKPPASIPPRGGASARAYLDTLIGLTGISVEELSLRYRTDFTRPDDPATSSAVWENIHTLRGFFRDSFQSVVDPQHTAPDVHQQPIIPDEMMGKAPFFLEYDEWVLLQQPVPYENYVQIRNVLRMDLSADARTILHNMAGAGPHQSEAKFHLDALVFNDDLQKALAFIDQKEYRAAIDLFNTLWTRLSDLIRNSTVGSNAVIDPNAVIAEFIKRRGKKVASMDDLYSPISSGNLGLLTMWQNPGFTYIGLPGDTAIDDYFSVYTPTLASALVYLYFFGLPTLIGQASLAIGLYDRAVRLLGRAAWRLVGAGEMGNGGGWSPNWSKSFELYVAGDLPYTIDMAKFVRYPSFDDDDSKYFGAGGAGILNIPPFDQLSQVLLPNGLHAVERAYFRLQMGDAMLAWADALYRANDASSIARARELYKGVYFLHGATPPIDPQWGRIDDRHFFPGYVNPAKASQLARAQLGFRQIEAGLNFFGYSDDMVPIQRYSTLIAAANAFAADAKSAETDFLNAMSQIETATIDTMKNTAMLKRAELGIQIAQQQLAIANDQVTQANVLVAQVNQQIDKVKQDIDDHDSFFGQLGDYLSGLASIAKGAKDAGEVLGAGQTAGDNLYTSQALGSTGIDIDAESTDALAIGGASVLGAYAAFAIASYVTLSSMADAASQRAEQLHSLENQNLMSANAQLDISRHQVTIAQLQQQIAQADADLATNLLVFAQERYLNIEFWSYMAALFQRTMRRYLDYGARAGWLAQRALAYEQNASINIVGFNYYPARYMGAGGADELQLDLASVEAQHLFNLQEMVPLKVTYSLARDFPLQLAKLKQTGSCQFRTSDKALQAAYPGMYGFRVRAVTPRIVRSNAGAPMRGVLANSGISEVSTTDGSLKPSTRPADALPITKFNIGTPDMNVFGLPGATLMQFEGSGMETIWSLMLPPASNPGGFGVLGDVVVTFDLIARFSPALFQTETIKPLDSATKVVLVSAVRHGLPGLNDLQKKAAADFVFDFGALDLPTIEKMRQVNNLFVLIAGAPIGSTIAAEVQTKKPVKSIKISLADGVAFSNVAPITDPSSTVPASPLNELAGVDAKQQFTVHIDKASNPGVDFSTIADVLLGIDYTATY